MIDNFIDKRKSFRMDYQYPVIYFEDNIFFKRGKEAWAVYKIKGFRYNFTSKEEKMNVWSRLSRLLWNLKLDGQIRAVPMTSSLIEDNEALKKRALGKLKLQAIRDIDYETQDLIEILGDEGNDYEFFIVVKLERPNSFFKSVREFKQSLVQDPIRLINKLSGLDAPEIYLRELQAYRNYELKTFNRINNHMAIERVDEYEIQRNIRHLLWFGIGEVPLRGKKPVYDKMRVDKTGVWKPHGDIIQRNGEKVLRPHSKDILTLCEGDINKEPSRHLEITQFYKGREKKVYQAYITISDMPDLVFPGNEWLFELLGSHSFAMNVSIRFRYMEYKASVNEVRKKQKDLADQDDNIKNSNNATPLDLLEKSEEAVLMEHDLKTKKFPLLLTTIIIGVAGKTKEELDDKVEKIRTQLGDIQTEVPAGDQWKLFNEMILGGDQFAHDYTLRLTPEHLAGAVFGATQKLGDDTGFYLGITGTLRKPVRIDPWKASQVNRPPNMVFLGPQGGGKSFSADLITLKSAKLGAKALIIDPKGDRANWEENLPSFHGEVKVITFTASDEDKGKLDPYNVMRAGVSNEREYKERMKQATGLALDIMMFLTAADRKDPRHKLLLQATERVSHKPVPSMNKNIEEFRIMAKEAEEANDTMKKNMCIDIADTLNSYKNMAYSALLFGDGDEEAISLESQVNVLLIQNLVFPKEGTLSENFTHQEIVGYACLLGISGFIFNFIMGPKDTLKIFTLDEATVINSTPVGKNLVNKIERMARALNQPGFFISQNASDFDEESKNNIGYKFGFRTTYDSEIDKMLKFYGLENTEENRNVFKELENGVALFQDLEGRVGTIAIDAVFKEYAVALDTRPENKKE